MYRSFFVLPHFQVFASCGLVPHVPPAKRRATIFELHGAYGCERIKLNIGREKMVATTNVRRANVFVFLPDDRLIRNFFFGSSLCRSECQKHAKDSGGGKKSETFTLPSRVDFMKPGLTKYGLTKKRNKHMVHGPF